MAAANVLILPALIVAPATPFLETEADVCSNDHKHF
jgi:hypothetical protein